MFFVLCVWGLKCFQTKFTLLVFVAVVGDICVRNTYFLKTHRTNPTTSQEFLSKSKRMRIGMAGAMYVRCMQAVNYAPMRGDESMCVHMQASIERRTDSDSLLFSPIFASFYGGSDVVQTPGALEV